MSTHTSKYLVRGVSALVEVLLASLSPPFSSFLAIVGECQMGK